MVKTYSDDYAEAELPEFDHFPYDLSPFQKHAIKAIVDGNHALVVALTGSGKSTPAEFAIGHFTQADHRVVYTSPIKALSNQKYYDFKLKFPDVSFGILTGDIKIDPDAQVVIMTAEILHNQLQNENLPDDIRCVIFDEVHYINDPDRGHVWEESIMRLDPAIQLVMLSATIATPHKFAQWVEDRPNTTNEVVLSICKTRAVPLIHYGFMTCCPNSLKKIKDKTVIQAISTGIDALQIIKCPKNNISMPTIEGFKKISACFAKHDINVDRPRVLNNICTFLSKNNMLPAIVFVFSRKQVAEYAGKLNVNLSNTKNPKTNIDRECEQILRRLPNYKEYLQLREYISLVNLLKKGVAIHHGGMLTVLREMVEIMFSRGHIKILFATETFAVGINLPIKTAVFTQVTKYTNEGIRPLFSHEYTQMSGRAGRRGIDPIGNVIHLFNFYRIGEKLSCNNVRNVLNDRPQALESKLKISYGWVLNNYENLDMIDYSLLQIGLKHKLDHVAKEMAALNNRLDISAEERAEVSTYRNLMTKPITKNNKKLAKELLQKSDTLNIILNRQGLDELRKKAGPKEQINNILTILRTNKFLDSAGLTPKGIIASRIKKLNPMLFADLIHARVFDGLLIDEILGVLSCFTYHKSREFTPELDICNMPTIREYNEKYEQLELRYRLATGTSYDIEYSLMEPVIEWCGCQSEDKCKRLLRRIELSLGDFMKIILEINNIADELYLVAEYCGYIDLCAKLQEAPRLLLKYIMAPQSLYV
jgi:superfamily II RNA helicase